MKWDYDLGREIAVRPEVGHGLFITNEGNFQYGNATLSFYDTQTRKIDNEVFFRANDQKLGDVAQSMTMYGGLGWIVVNNSHVIFAIDPVTFKEVGRITNLTSPRYIHFCRTKKPMSHRSGTTAFSSSIPNGSRLRDTSTARV